MKHRLLAIAIGIFCGLFMFQSILAQETACSGATLEKNEIGLDYQGHCIAVDTTGPPVQSVIVQRTEDLDGAESVHGILLVRTVDGWVLGPEFFADVDIDNAEVGDSGYLVVDGEP